MSRSPRNLRPLWLVLVFAVASVIVGASVPAGAEVRFGESVPALSWDASLDVLVIGYYVKYGVLDGMTTNAIDAGTDRVVELAGLTPGKTNFIFVTAYNAQRVESDPSEARYYCPLPAEAPAAMPVSATMDPVASGLGKTVQRLASRGLALNLSKTPSSAGLLFFVTAGTRYQVQMSRDLITWRNRDIFESGFTGDYAWGDPDPARDPAHFYRVLAVSPVLPDR